MRLGDDRPRIVPPGSEEAAASPGVAGNTRLVNQQEHGIAIAIETQIAQ